MPSVPGVRPIGQSTYGHRSGIQYIIIRDKSNAHTISHRGGRGKIFMEKKNTVGSLLLEYGKITDAELKEGLRLQQETGRRLGEILIDMGTITPQDIEWILSKQLDIPFIIVDESSIDKDLLLAFPKDFLQTNRILPMYETDDEIAIVTDDPFNNEAFSTIEKHRKKYINLSAGNGDAIDAILRKAFRKEGSSELISMLQDIIIKLRGTCLYRLDFLDTGEGLMINAYGFGILRNMSELQCSYSRQDIIKSLDALNIKFLYHDMQNTEETGFALCIYIIEDILEPTAYPAVLGTFGLGLPDGVVLTALKSKGLPRTIESDTPLKGYPYLYSRAVEDPVEVAIFTIDNAPIDYKNYYVKASLPSRCAECDGVGCQECSFLGLKFKSVEGVYSYSDIINMLKEV